MENDTETGFICYGPSGNIILVLLQASTVGAAGSGIHT